MRVTLKFDGLTTEQMRAVLAQCSKERDHFPHATEPWEPRVNCEGPSHFGVKVSPTNAGAAKRIVDAAEALS